MRNQSNRSHDLPGSPTSIRDVFDHDIRIVRVNDESPFDEPPHSEIRCSSREKYSLDGYSFYQSSSKLESGDIVDNNRRNTPQTLRQQSDSQTSLMHGNDRDDDEGTEISSDYSSDDGSSFVSLNHNTENAGNLLISDCHNCDASEMVSNLKTFWGVPVSSFRSKPLPRPVVWKGYTCFKGKWPCVSPAVNKSSSGRDESQRDKSRTNTCEDVLPVDAQSDLSSVASDIDSQMQDFFHASGPHECFDCGQTTAHELLKSWIFSEDSDFGGSTGDREDSDSITYGSK